MTEKGKEMDKKRNGEVASFDVIGEKLRTKIVVPELVRQKTLQALASIKEGTAGKEETPGAKEGPGYIPMEEADGKPGKKGSYKKRMAVFLAAAVLAAGGVTAGAGVYLRSQEKEALPELTDTASKRKGITLTVTQNFVDNYFARLSFRVQGYEIKEGRQPFFEECHVMLDGRDIVYDRNPADTRYKVWWGFDNGIAMGADQNPVRAWDNAPVSALSGEYGSEGDWYVKEDGSLELEVVIFTPEEKGALFHKPVHIELKNLGGVTKADFVPDEAGEETWVFDGTLADSSVREVHCDGEIGDTGIKVRKAELSPVSLTAYYDKRAFGLQSTPELRGVRMKDGTLYPCLNAGPGMDVTPPDREGDDYDCFAIDRILVVEEIDALLFEKKAPGEGEAWTEENLYIVPLEE